MPEPAPEGPGPYFFPVLTPLGQIDPRHKAELFSEKVFAMSDNGNVVGYPDQPVGTWRREWAPPVLNNPVGGRRRRSTRRRGGANNNVNLPIYYVGLIPQPQGGFGPAPAYFHFGPDRLVAEYHSGLVFLKAANGVVMGYPNQPVARWVEGPPPAGGRSRRRKASRRSRRR